MKLALKDIIIGERQRLDLGDLSDLESMAEEDVGQIAPIIVHKTLQGYELVDGRRRLAKASLIGWTHVEVIERDTLTTIQKQKMELLADIGRKDRGWQDVCLSVAKVHRMMIAERAEDGESWTIRAMARFTGYGKSAVGYMLQVADELSRQPKDENIWGSANYTDALSRINDRNNREAQAELERRRELLKAIVPELPIETKVVLREKEPGSGVKVPTIVNAVTGATIEAPSVVQEPDNTSEAIIGLELRAELFNIKYVSTKPPNTPFYYYENDGREFIFAFWFLGGGNVSDFYGSYQVEYLKRMSALFKDITGRDNVVHLFSGSLPPSDEYFRVGMDPTGQYKSDLECDVHFLSTYLPFKPMLIYADPPYSQEDSEHYKNSMVNRAAVMEQCGIVLRPGGYLVWMDQALPIFSNDVFQLVGAIAYIRSTGNRFRVISIFRKHAETKTPEGEYA
jgi:hypothetical protein